MIKTYLSRYPEGAFVGSFRFAWKGYSADLDLSASQEAEVLSCGFSIKPEEAAPEPSFVPEAEPTALSALAKAMAKKG